MSATKTARRFDKIEIPVSITSDQRTIANTNSSIQAALTRNRLIKLEGYAIPDREGELFRRQITIVKRPRDKGIENIDMPDMEDVQLTDMPWMGDVTFKAASRQFKAKNKFTVVVQIVLLYGDYLYVLSDALSPSVNDGSSPSVYDVTPPTSRNAYYCVNRSGPMTSEEIKSTPWIPFELIKKMTKLGYHLVEDGFVNPNFQEGTINHKLTCHLYGRLQTVKDTSVCLVSV